MKTITPHLFCQVHFFSNDPGNRKTQIAIEYGYRLHEKASQTWVFWVNASSAETFNRSYADIANNAKIPGRNDEDVNILHLVHQWFLNTSEDWLLIIDNNDNGDVLSRSWPKIQKSGDQNSKFPIPPFLSLQKAGCRSSHGRFPVPAPSCLADVLIYYSA